jgi:hypothetical protein
MIVIPFGMAIIEKDHFALAGVIGRYFLVDGTILVNKTSNSDSLPWALSLPYAYSDRAFSRFQICLRVILGRSRVRQDSEPFVHRQR